MIPHNYYTKQNIKTCLKGLSVERMLQVLVGFLNLLEFDFCSLERSNEYSFFLLKTGLPGGMQILNRLVFGCFTS